MENKKTIFFTVEIKSRELIPKCLLAYELVKKGFRVYIGTFTTIESAVKKVDSSIFFHKSTHIHRSEFYKSLGSKFVFLDEEGGITIPRSKLKDFCDKRYGVVSKEKNDLIFLPGKKYEELISKMQNMQNVEVYTSGWPRVDLWRKDFTDLYDKEKNNILKKHGNYYLLITSFGMTSEETMKDRISSSTTDFEREYRTHKYNAFLDYVDLIEKLSRLMSSEEKLIIRPHPSEDLSDWKKIISNLNNVYVERSGDITPWILGAEAIIQYGSTTAVQAALNAIPSIQYKIKKEEGITDTPVFELSYDADTPQEVYALLQKYKNQQDNSIKEKAEKILESDMAFDKNELSAKKIANRLDSISIDKVDEVTIDFIDKLRPWKRILHNKFTLFKRKVLKESTLKRIQIEKIEGGIEKKEVAFFINKFEKMFSGSNSINVKQVCKDLVCLEKK